jgi:hypothetical protein
MTTDRSREALRAASPRRKAGFDDWVERLDAVRAKVIATEPVAPAPRPALRVPRPRLVGLSAAALTAAIVAVVVGVNAASPPSADAAARRALAATAASSSGTMTETITHDGTTDTLETTQWNGDDVALNSTAIHVVGDLRQVILAGGGAYLQQADGSWVHYADASNVGPNFGPVLLARANAAGNTADQILSVATGLTQTSQADGTTLYTGTIPGIPSNQRDEVAASSDAILRAIATLRGSSSMDGPSGTHGDLQLRMVVGTDGLVQQVSLTFDQTGSGSATGDGVYTVSVAYSQLGSTPAIAPPTTFTDVTAPPWPPTYTQVPQGG